jgi:hypothetical protein
MRIDLDKHWNRLVFVIATVFLATILLVSPRQFWNAVHDSLAFVDHSVSGLIFGSVLLVVAAILNGSDWKLKTIRAGVLAAIICWLPIFYCCLYLVADVPVFAAHNYKPTYPPEYPVVPPLPPKIPTVRISPIPKAPPPPTETAPPVIVQGVAYGNLAARCDELGKEIIAGAAQRESMEPIFRNRLNEGVSGDERKQWREQWERWYRENDGIFFHAHYWETLLKLHGDLNAKDIRDTRLDDLMEEHATKYAARQRNVQQAINDPLSYHLSIDEIREIGERLQIVAKQIPR